MATNNVHTYDALIIGAGLAGTRAAIELAGNSTVAVLSKVFPTRSHSTTAQGGVAAALGNMSDDSPEIHMFDTVKGSDYLGDQNQIEILCESAPATVYELEHMGVAFSRTPEGKIAQRPFGGHSHPRACYSADRTGHVILHTLFEQSIKAKVNYYSEFFVTELIVNNGAVSGAVAVDLKTGEIHTFHSKAVMLATGGGGRIYKITSNAHQSTGDGNALVYNAGFPIQDMEFTQFHPTGLYPLGILITEGVRGEGGVLLNDKGEAFMEKYAPNMKDLAPRDIVSRSILTEIEAGRGIGGKDFVYLQIHHIGRAAVLAKLPEIHKFCMTYLGIDCAKQPIPVMPTAHYMMGGIPTDTSGRVISDENSTPVPGLYSAGEAACESVHGGNRLGCNSLADTVVFGRRTGKDMAEFIHGEKLVPLPKGTGEKTKELIGKLLAAPAGEKISRIRDEMQREMTMNCSVFRTEDKIAKASKKIAGLSEEYKKISLDDHSRSFNTELQEALELKNLLDTAGAVTASAINRKESRGAHSRVDYPNRDDVNFLKHTLIFKNDGNPRIAYRDVVITRFQPQERKY